MAYFPVIFQKVIKSFVKISTKLQYPYLFIAKYESNILSLYNACKNTLPLKTESTTASQRMLGLVWIESIRQWSLMHYIRQDSGHPWHRFRCDMHLLGYAYMFVIFCVSFWKKKRSKNGGRGPSAHAQARGEALAPPFFERFFFSKWYTENCKHACVSQKVHVTPESASRMSRILSNVMHERSLTHWFESNKTEHSLESQYFNDFW